MDNKSVEKFRESKENVEHAREGLEQLEVGVLKEIIDLSGHELDSSRLHEVVDVGTLTELVLNLGLKETEKMTRLRWEMINLILSGNAYIIQEDGSRQYIERFMDLMKKYYDQAIELTKAFDQEALNNSRIALPLMLATIYDKDRDPHYFNEQTGAALACSEGYMGDDEESAEY